MTGIDRDDWPPLRNGVRHWASPPRWRDRVVEAVRARFAAAGYTVPSDVRVFFTPIEDDVVVIDGCLCHVCGQCRAPAADGAVVVELSPRIGGDASEIVH